MKPCDLPGCDCYKDELDVPVNPALEGLKWGAALGFIIGLGVALLVVVGVAMVSR